MSIEYNEILSCDLIGVYALWYDKNTKQYQLAKGCSMTSPNYMTKTGAVTLLMGETGRGRRFIENALDALVAAGRIKIERDTFDTRVWRISVEDVELVRRVLKGEEQV